MRAERADDGSQAPVGLVAGVWQPPLALVDALAVQVVEAEVVCEIRLGHFKEGRASEQRHSD